MSSISSKSSERQSSTDSVRKPCAHKKRLIVCCDGTWMNSDNGFDRSENTLQIPSNVTRLARAIAPRGHLHPTSRPASAFRPDPEEPHYIPQIVYYQAGVGSGEGVLTPLIGAATGLGLSEHIQEAFAFLSANWERGDEIFLFGFSRGAFTARSIAGMIGYVGLLTKKGMGSFYEIFKDYEHWQDGEYKPALPHEPFGKGSKNKNPTLHGEVNKKKYREMLEEHELSVLDVPIEVVGVWDTVGALGIPTTSWLDKLPLPMRSNKHLLFYDTALDTDCIKNAYHALALDEMRYNFPPALWELPPGSRTKLKQTWFPGVHANVGGGMSDQQLSDITLAWMLSNLEDKLDFDEGYIEDQFDLTQKEEIRQFKALRPYSLGQIQTIQEFASRMMYHIVGDHSIRTPGQYRRVINPTTSNLETYDKAPTKKPTTLAKKINAYLRPPPNKPLVNTNEHMHASVRLRLGLPNAPGINDDEKSLSDYLYALTHLRMKFFSSRGYRADALSPAKGRQTWRRTKWQRVGWRCVGVPNVRVTGDTSAEELRVELREGQQGIHWVPLDKAYLEKEGFGVEMPEDELGKWEVSLLKRWYADDWRSFLSVGEGVGGKLA